MDEVFPNMFYFIRHGETDANKSGLMCGGDWDIGLNEVGCEQAKSAAIKARSCGINISHVFSSPLQRARETAQCFADVFNRPITYIDDLGEWKLGEWDRRPCSEISPFFDADLDPPYGETLADFRARIRRVIKRIISQCETPLIVSHGAVWKQVSFCLGLEYIRLLNGVVLEIKNGKAAYLDK